MGFTSERSGANVEHLGIVYNPEPGNNSSAFRKSIDEIANKVGITSIETPSGDSSDIDHLIRSFEMRRMVDLFFYRMRLRRFGALRLLRWLRGASCPQPIRFASSARPMALCHTG